MQYKNDLARAKGLKRCIEMQIGFWNLYIITIQWHQYVYTRYYTITLTPKYILVLKTLYIIINCVQRFCIPEIG